MWTKKNLRLNKKNIFHHFYRAFIEGHFLVGKSLTYGWTPVTIISNKASPQMFKRVLNAPLCCYTAFNVGFKLLFGYWVVDLAVHVLSLTVYIMTKGSSNSGAWAMNLQIIVKFLQFVLVKQLYTKTNLFGKCCITEGYKHHLPF